MREIEKTMMEKIDSELKKYRDLLFDKLSFANVAIVRKNGQPHVSPVWFDLSNEDFQNHIININTAKGRVKANNMKIGDHVAISILDPDNSYRYLGIDGIVIDRIMGNEAEKHIDALAKKYINKEIYPYRTENEQRIKIKIKITNIHRR